jgi:hypothetical protein
VTALAVIAAVGQALQAGAITVVAVGVACLLVSCLFVAVLTGRLTLRDWTPGRLRKVLHSPPPRCFLCGSETDLEPVGPGSLTVACRDIDACDQRRRERADAEGAGSDG